MFLPEEKMEEKEQPLSKFAYFAGLFIIFAAIFSQYLVGGYQNTLIGMAVVYGIPVIFVSFIFGRTILKNAFKNITNAIRYGFAFFGIFSVIGIILSMALLFLIYALDPASFNILQNPNPVFNPQTHTIWALIILSLFVVGPAEEYLFRGFLFGGMLKIFGRRHWLAFALLSSALFTSVHIYYIFNLGVISLVAFVNIFFLGIVFALTYYFSGGNLLVPALIHGLYDATGFLGSGVSSTLAVVLQAIMVGVGVLIAFKIFSERSASGNAPADFAKL